MLGMQNVFPAPIGVTLSWSNPSGTINFTLAEKAFYFVTVENQDPDNPATIVISSVSAGGLLSTVLTMNRSGASTFHQGITPPGQNYSMAITAGSNFMTSTSQAGGLSGLPSRISITKMEGA